MRRNLLVFGLLALFVQADFTATGQLLLSESFVADSGYTTATNLAGQNSWTKTGSGPDVTVQDATPLGNRGNYIQMPTPSSSTSRVYKGFASTAAGTNTFFCSFLLNISSASANSNGYFLSLGDPVTGTSYFARVFAQASGSGYVLGISKQAATATYGSTVLDYGTSYQIAVRYSFVSGSANDMMYLWINPVSNAEPDTGSAEVAITSGTDVSASNVGNFHWHNRGVTNPVGKFDEVNVAAGSTSAAAWAALLTGVPLPVSIPSVAACRKNSGVQVSWEGAQEENIRHYEIERSGDGRSFASVAVVATKGSAGNGLSYSWLDRQPLDGAGYYRVVAVEWNGKSSYSCIVTTRAGKAADTRFSLHPNPARGAAATLRLKAARVGNYTVEVFSTTGAKLRTERLAHGGETTDHVLPLTGLAPGLYTVRLTGDGVDLREPVVVAAD